MLYSPPTHESTKIRIEELSVLGDGWLDGEQGCAIDKDGLYWLQSKLLCFDERLLPWVFPSIDPDFDVLLEWTTERKNEISLWVNVKTKRSELHILSLHPDFNNELLLDMSHDESWEWVQRRING
jgi:hypothetical protein